MEKIRKAIDGFVGNSLVKGENVIQSEGKPECGFMGNSKNKWERLEAMDDFLEKCKLLKLTQE